MDDNPAIHADYRKILGASGERNGEIQDLEAELFGERAAAPRRVEYQLDSAHQGKEALEMVKAARARGQRYAMAFMDVRMPPGWNGVETTRQIWREDPDVEVVICTAYSDYGWSEIVAELGQTDRLLILKKPFDAMEVQQLAHALTEKWTLRRKAEMTVHTLEDHLEREMAKRKQVEAELRHAQKLEAVGRLAAGLAHEVNTPLQFAGDNAAFISDACSSLCGVIDTYRGARPEVPEPLRASLERAEQGADVDYLREQLPQAVDDLKQGLRRVAATVKALKNFASIDRPEKAFVDLNEALCDTLAVSHPEYDNVADVVTELQPLPLVLCRPADLNQVFLAVIANGVQAIADAKKASGVKGRLRVASRPDDKHVIIEVSDTGVGIPDTIRDRIFEPFFTTRDVGRGAGLGLSVAHGILKGHGGTITFDSTVGKGTTFVIRVPLKPAELAGTESSVFDEVGIG